MSRDWRLYLKDILQCCERIAKYTDSSTQQELMADEAVLALVLRDLQIIGEASKQLPREVTDSMPDHPWGNIRGMRDVLVHHYFRLDDDVIWAVITIHLPPLRRDVTEYIKTMD